MTELDDEVLLARVYLNRVAEPASVPMWHLIAALGPVDAARALRSGRANAALLAETEARRAVADPEADLLAAERHGVRLVVPESADWPHFGFAALDRAVVPRVAAYTAGRYTRRESGEPVPPVALWVRGSGDLATVGVRSVGIVGARAATAYGEHVTADLAYGLAGRDVVVVSGGAYGIDAAAHRAALAAGGQTVLVSAGGLDRAYPPGHTALFDRAAESGLILSESPPGCAPQRRRFLTRNRLIAALSTGVVVVEAASRSGAINTAGHASVLGRPLMAVPGPVTSAMSVGCHDLLRRDVDPALLVTSVEDVLAVVGRAGEGLARRDPGPADVRSELDALDPTARRVFEGLPARRFAGPQEIAARSGVSPLDVIRVLPTLDIAGLIEASDVGEYRVSPRVRSRVRTA
jgi:DNA processing protein